MLEKLKQEVYKANLELPQRGLIKYTWGNVSGFDEEQGCLLSNLVALIMTKCVQKIWLFVI